MPLGEIGVGVPTAADLRADAEEEVVLGLPFDEERHRAVLESVEAVVPTQGEPGHVPA
jgi:hypothetical protein